MTKMMTALLFECFYQTLHKAFAISKKNLVK